MVIEVLTCIAVGALLAVLGLLTWKKQKVTILHDYHYRNVKKEDLPAYTRAMGIGQVIIGAGLCLTGLLRLVTESMAAWVPFVIALVVGLVIFHKAQMKYNGSWFS